MRQLAGITDMQRGANIHCFCRLPLNLKHLFQMSFSSKTLWYLVKFKVIIYLCITRVTRVTRATIMTGKSSRDNVRMFQEGICQLFPSLRHIFISKEAMKVFFMILKEEWKGSFSFQYKTKDKKEKKLGGIFRN